MVSRSKLGSKTLVLSDANNGVLNRFQYIPKRIQGALVRALIPVKVKVVQDTVNHIPKKYRDDGHVVVRRSSGEIDIKNVSGNSLISGNGFLTDAVDKGSDYVNVKSWTSWKNIYLSDSLAVSAENAGLHTIDFSLNNKKNGGEIKKESVKLAAVNVSFDSSFTQTGGFDEEDEDEIEWVSVKKGASTWIKVTIDPGANRKYKVTVQNTNVANVPGGSRIINGGVSYVPITGMEQDTTHLRICGIQENGDCYFLKSLNIAVYEERVFDIDLFTVRDPRVDNTGFIPIDTANYRAQADSVLKQAVGRIGSISYTVRELYYDENQNGSLDVYPSEDETSYGPEVDILLQANGVNSINHMRDFCYTWRLSQDAEPAGLFDAQVLHLESTVLLPRSVECIIYTNGMAISETIHLNRPPGSDEVFLMNSLRNSYPAGSYISYKPATGVMIRTKQIAFTGDIPENRRMMLFTYLHETLHLSVHGELLDIVSLGNLMHFGNIRNNTHILNRKLFLLR